MLPEAVEFPTQFHFTSARSKAVRITLTASVEALIGIFRAEDAGGRRENLALQV